MVYERCGILGLFRREGAPTTLAEYEVMYESCNFLYGGTPTDRASAPDGLACDGGITRDGACVPSDGTPCEGGFYASGACVADGTPCGDDARYVSGACVPYTTCTPPMAEHAPPDGASDRECRACPTFCDDGTCKWNNNVVCCPSGDTTTATDVTTLAGGMCPGTQTECPVVGHELGPVATDFDWCGASRSNCNAYYVERCPTACGYPASCPRRCTDEMRASGEYACTN